MVNRLCLWMLPRGDGVSGNEWSKLTLFSVLFLFGPRLSLLVSDSRGNGRSRGDGDGIGTDTGAG